MRKNFKKLFFIFCLVSFCFLFLTPFALSQELEEIYPQVPGAETPRTVKTFLPKYIQFLFNFAIIIAGLVAFLSLVYGGIRYLASAGNPAALSDARGQIVAGILGLIILLSAFLVLIQINPQLVILTIEKKGVTAGVILYPDQPATPLRPARSAIEACHEDRGNPQGEDGKDFLMVKGSMSFLGDPAVGGFSDQAKAIYFYDSSEELAVKIFRERNYGPEPAGENPVWDSEKDAVPYPFLRGSCFEIPPENKSIELIWKLPGVYLFTDNDCKENPRRFDADIADFGDFHDKARSIKIVSRTRVTCGFPDAGCIDLTWCADLAAHPVCRKTVPLDKFGAVLYQDSNFKKDAEVFFGGSTTTWPPRCITLDDEVNFGNGEGDWCNQGTYSSYCREAVGKKASAITIFKQRTIVPPDAGGGVTIYEHENLNLDEAGGECGPPDHHFRPLANPEWIDSTICNIMGEVSSIKIEGDYIAVLFREDGRGQVFRTGDVVRLKDQHIGDNQARYMLVIPIAP